MKASTSVETTTMEASTETRLPASGKAPRNSPMIKAAEGAGVCTSLSMRCRESMLATGESSRSSAMKPAGSVKSASGSIEVVAVHENSAVGFVVVIVETNVVVMPIVSPVVPAPAKPAEEANSKAKAKCDSRTL